MSLSDCLSCGAPLGRGAKKCRCGWTATETYVGGPKMDCFNAPRCSRPAMIRTDRYSGTKGRYQDFCVQCEHEEHAKKAEEFCERMGLNTTNQRIEFCRKMAKKMFPSLRFKDLPRERVPGEDEEEREAA